jgi:CPA1 family monovalent cation:H+ antiporter
VITLVTPYAIYALAEAAHVSGVTAVVVAAVTVSALGPRLTSAVNRLQLAAVTGTVVFLLESVVFALIGLQLPGLARDLPADRWLVPVVALTGTVVLMRLVWVFPLVAVIQARARETVSWAAPAVATWAGTRGVVPLAAALSIPLTVADGSPFPHRELLLVLAIGVCVLTLVVQGLTLQTLTRRSGVAEPPAVAEREHALADLRPRRGGADPGAGARGPRPGAVGAARRPDRGARRSPRPGREPPP